MSSMVTERAEVSSTQPAVATLDSIQEQPVYIIQHVDRYLHLGLYPDIPTILTVLSLQHTQELKQFYTEVGPAVWPTSQESSSTGPLVSPSANSLLAMKCHLAMLHMLTEILASKGF